MKKLALLFLVLFVACGGASKGASFPLKDLRADGQSSRDPDVVGRWALAEALQPGGDTAKLSDAEKKLATLPSGAIYGDLAKAMLAESHGSPKIAADAFVDTLADAQIANDPIAPLAAWYAVHRLRALRGTVAELWTKHEGTLVRIRTRPGAIGWRAEAELVEWSTIEDYDKAKASGKELDDRIVAMSGCAKGIRMAGPFGRGNGPDRRKAFGPESPGTWPLEWPDDGKGSTPKVRKTSQPRCLAVSAERADGIFYAETFVTAKHPMDVVLAIQGSVAIWVDDALVAERDLRDWGIWQKFGAAVRISEGRHRIVARVLDDVVAIRIVSLDGTPADVTTDSDPAPGYSVVPPIVLGDPNPLSHLVAAHKGVSPVETWLGAMLAHGEGLDDVAAVLLLPMVTPDDAGALALEAAAAATRGDPLYPQDVRRRMEKTLRQRAAKKDPRLWVSRTWLALEDAEEKGLFEGVDPLRKLWQEFPGEPEIAQGLAHVYEKLGWRAERMTTLADIATRFPDDPESLRAYLDALEDDGSLADADKVATQIQKVDPDAEIALERAMARHDWKSATTELERIAKRRPDRKDTAARIAAVLARSGDPSAAAQQLAKALKAHPEDAAVRFRLADRAYAAGDDLALRHAVADAIQAGSNPADLLGAIDLLEGATDLEPYRIDGKKVISEFVAWEKAGHRMDGLAARVLDYAAVWVHPDGSSDMLEHEIQKLQSQEAIGKEAEQKPPEGLVLRIRVIKPDGRVLEPEPVSGKPTLTMPHLEVGDFLEIEHIISLRGDGEKGRRYRGPHWFFREADKGYWRSEFIAITPKDKSLEVETRGNVPPPKTKTTATLIERRWRIDGSPPVPDEPDSPRPQEYLPSVRIGWGVSLQESLERLVDVASDETPLDPRLKEYADDLVTGIPAADVEGRARKVYRSVLDRIQDGNESDGRRAITGKSGSHQSAFMHLMKQLGLPVELVLVKNRLAMPALGNMSEIENWDSLILRIGAKDPLYLTVRDKFAPFGYVPSESRGQPAYRLVPGLPKESVSTSGVQDRVSYEGRADVKDDGGAAVDLSIKYQGKLAITMRNYFDKVPEAQLRDFVETRLLARNLPAARVKDLDIQAAKELDKPLVVHVKCDVPQIVKQTGSRLILYPMFAMRIAQLASLPQRQTPMLLSSSSHVEVHLEIVVPNSWHVPASLPSADVKDGDRLVSVKDSIAGHALRLDRVIDIPAGRIEPGKPYEDFVRFTQDSDATIEREIALSK